MRVVHGLWFGLWVVLGAGCASNSDPKQEQDAMEKEPSTAPDASADDNVTTPPKEEENEPVGQDDPATPGNDAAHGVACGADVSDCGDKVCCSVGFGKAACLDACEGGQQPTICDGPEDCGKGTVCCSGIGSNTCVAADKCTSWFSCHDDTHCPAGLTCEPGGSFTWWGFCK